MDVSFEHLNYGDHTQGGIYILPLWKTALEEEDAVLGAVDAVLIVILARHANSELGIVLLHVDAVPKPGALN